MFYINKDMIDGSHKDKKHVKYDKNFSIKVYMTKIEDSRIGHWENKMMKEFKTVKIAKAPKSRLRKDTEGGGNNSGDEQDYGAGGQQDNDGGFNVQDIEISELAVPSDLQLNQPANIALIKQQKQGAGDDGNLAGRDGQKASFCAVPVIEEQPLH